MSGPPKKEPALRHAGSLKTYDRITVARDFEADNLFPVNVQALTKAGVKFDWRKSGGDIICRCPLCQGKLIVHESKPWAFCVGETNCGAGKMPFEELLAAIRRAS